MEIHENLRTPMKSMKIHEDHGNSRNIANSAGPKPPAPPQGSPKHITLIGRVSFVVFCGGAESADFIGNHGKSMNMLK